MTIKEVLTNELTRDQLNTAQTDEEIERILVDNGVDISSFEEELTDETLESIAGGYIATTPFTRWLADKLKGKGSTIHTSSSGSSHGSTGGRSF